MSPRALAPSGGALAPSDMTRRFEAVRCRVEEAARAAGRNPAEITLVAVSKLHPAARVAELARYWAGCGQPVFGENYVQEAVDKMPQVEKLAGFAPLWHFVGHIQSRKAKDIAGRFALVHSLDSLSLAKNLEKELQKMYDAGQRALPAESEAGRQIARPSGSMAGRLPGPLPGPLPAQDVLVQVNIGREPQKSGVAPEDLPKFLDDLAAFPAVRVKGLMCLPPDMDDPEDARPFFSHMRELAEAARKTSGLDLPHLSMGMSHDFEPAVAEGATIVRVGTAIFGPR